VRRIKTKKLFHILKELQAKKSIYELDAIIDYSKRTIRKRLNEFEEIGWVEEETKERKKIYSLTPRGRALVHSIIAGKTYPIVR